MISPLDIGKYFYAERKLSSFQREKIMREYAEKVFAA